MQMLLFKAGLVPMVPYKSELGKEITLGAGVDLEGDKAGFTSVELGPLVSNNRVDNVYRSEGSEMNGYSARAFTMVKTFMNRKKDDSQLKISASVQPSFSLVNLPQEAIKNNLSVACNDIFYSVDQINLDFSPLENDYFKTVKDYVFQPKNFGQLLYEINQDMDKSFALKLLHEKLKQQGKLSDPNFVYVYHKELMDSVPTSMPTFFVKAHSPSMINLAATLQPGTIDGLIVKASSTADAAELYRAARSHANLKKVDLQVEIDVDSLDDVQRLREIGYSKVQVPGSSLFKKGPYWLRQR